MVIQNVLTRPLTVQSRLERVHAGRVFHRCRQRVPHGDDSPGEGAATDSTDAALSRQRERMKPRSGSARLTGAKREVGSYGRFIQLM